MNNFPVLNNQSIKLCEDEYKLATNFGDNVLMELAGSACAMEILKFCGPFDDDHLVIYAGPGKNGGDGVVAAYFLAGHTKKITICMPVASNLSYVNENIERIKKFCANVEFSTDVVEGDIYVDAIFGTGFSKKSDGVFEKFIKFINQQANTVISIDVPSGVDVDGEISSDFDAVMPDLTLAIGCLKPLHQHAKAEEICGDIVYLDIGLPFTILQNHAANQKIAC
ncbi:MAG: NAD(P)H-hydrate epimerase [Proteobacteria bacterium]|nr:NAD(P)H-hydrate epimerase [Pseudomonadota bacterium]